MPSKEELRSVAVNFTKYILNNRLIKSGIVSKKELLQLFVKYQDLNPSSVQCSEIIEALQQACLVKRRRTHQFADDNRYVEFRDQVFLLINEVAPDFKDFINQQNGLVPRFSNKSNSKFNELVEDFKSVSLDNSKDEGTSREDIDGKDRLSKHAELQNLYRSNRKAFVRSIDFLQVDNLNQKILGLHKKEVFVIAIKNTAKAALTVRILDAFNIYNTDDVKFNYKPNSFGKGSSFKIELNVNFSNYGIYLYPIVFEICTSRRPKKVIQFLIEPKFEVLTEEVLDLGPVEPYRSNYKTIANFPPLKIVSGDPLSFKNAMQLKLSVFNHPIRDSLKRILKCEFKPQKMLPEDEPELSIMRKLLCNKSQSQVIHNRYGLNCDNYVKRFEFLLWAEEFEMEKEMGLYNQTDVTLKIDVEKNLIKLNVPGLAEGRPSIMKGDKVYVREKNAEVKYEGVVHIVESDSVFLAFNDTFRDNYLHYRLLDVEFSVNTSDIRLCHRALKQIKSRNMVSFMFPSENNTKLKNTNLSPGKIIKETFNKEIKSNPEQMIAINSIVKNTAFPAPYILFGPPGTGKTATIVEAITQIWHRYKRSKKICVCAPSNSAADLITKRLLKYEIPAREIFRLYALSRSESEIPDDLKICSNYDRIMKEVYFPSKESVKFKTVVVLTPITAGRLVTGGFKGGHFDYLFMDEAGHAIEPEMIVPIIGLLTTSSGKRKPSQVKGSLILAGDPKQLGPVIQSKLAVHIGLEMSLLERLMSQCKIYQKDAETNTYNPDYITKLVNNYRSHKDILHVPNLLFYDNELKVAGKLTRINCAADWIELKKPGFPVIFHSVKGSEERESNSPSYFNQYEIAVVSQYLQKLINHKLGNYPVKEEHIGIITPYKKQVQKIRQYLRKPNWTKVTVASVEEFQGQERLIIIISTVRSQIKLVNHDYQFGLGFLKNAKRFNVAVTRAIALLIVIGNPDILQCDPNWRSLIEYCVENDSYNGPLPSYSVPSDFQPIEKLGLDLSVLTPNADCLPADDP